ncbi:hypothetical protein [Nostoc sp.]|uniref:hypothetical protein n=1 Tax=Nostoc sp. TaxID=1180 RepID=UPI002FF8E317
MPKTPERQVRKHRISYFRNAEDVDRKLRELPQDLEKAIAGVPEYFNLRPSLIIPAKQITLQQILDCPYQG